MQLPDSHLIASSATRRLLDKRPVEACRIPGFSWLYVKDRLVCKVVFECAVPRHLCYGCCLDTASSLTLVSCLTSSKNGFMNAVRGKNLWHSGRTDVRRGRSRRTKRKARGPWQRNTSFFLDYAVGIGYSGSRPRDYLVDRATFAVPHVLA